MLEEAKRPRKFLGKVILVGIIVIVVLAGILYFRYSQSLKIEQARLDAIEQYKLENPVVQRTYEVPVSEDKNITVSMMKEMIAPASKLISYEYFYTAASSYEKNKQVFGVTVPLTTDHTVYMYSGVIGVGIRMNNIQYDIDNENDKIVITLPKLEILSHTLDPDSFEFYNLKDSIFTSTDISEYEGFRTELKEKEEIHLADKEEFWEHAKSSTEANIENVLLGSGQLTDYDIEFQWEE